MLKKNESKSLLEEVDDIYLGEFAGISKIGPTIVSSAYAQPNIFRAINLEHKDGISKTYDEKGKIF